VFVRLDDIVEDSEVLGILQDLVECLVTLVVRILSVRWRGMRVLTWSVMRTMVRAFVRRMRVLTRTIVWVMGRTMMRGMWMLLGTVMGWMRPSMGRVRATMGRLRVVIAFISSRKPITPGSTAAFLPAVLLHTKPSLTGFFATAGKRSKPLSSRLTAFDVQGLVNYILCRLCVPENNAFCVCDNGLGRFRR
jgi:hypothetical protein